MGSIDSDHRDENWETSDEFQIDIDEQVFTSGVVSRLLEIPIWVLKQLDKEGIVSPPRREEGCTRMYSMRDLKLLKHCWFYMSVKRVRVPGLRVILQMKQRMDYTDDNAM